MFLGLFVDFDFCRQNKFVFYYLQFVRRLFLACLLIPIKLLCQNLLCELEYFSTFRMLIKACQQSPACIIFCQGHGSVVAVQEFIEEATIFIVCIVEHRPPT